jgi:dynactin-5
MSDTVLRGDLARPRTESSSSTTATSTSSSAAAASKPSSTAISIGKNTIIAPSTLLRPPSRLSRGTHAPYPLKIGDNVLIGPRCTIQAAHVASHVHVGADVVLGPFCVVRENVRVLDGAVVPAGMVVPPGVVVGGCPARIVGEVGEGWGVGGVGEGWVEGGDLREVVRAVR